MEASSSTKYFAATALFMATSYLMWKRWSGRDSKSVEKKPTLPSPRRLLPDWFGFISGHTLLLDHEKLVQQLEAWADEFGGDFELNMTGKRVIIVTDAAEIRRMLALRPELFRRGITPSQLVWAAQEMGFTPNMFTNEGRQWGRSRRLVAPLLNPHNVMGMLPAISMMIERFCKICSQEARAGKPVDMKDLALRFTHDVLCNSALGLDVHSIEAKPGEPCQPFDAMLGMTAFIWRLASDPLSQLGWTWLGSLLAWVREAKQMTAMLDEVALDAIAETRRLMSCESQVTTEAPDSDGVARKPARADGMILRKMVSHSRGTGDGSGGKIDPDVDRSAWSDQLLLTEIKNLFVAGTETSGFTIAMFMYFVAKYPRVHARCRKEALHVASETKGIIRTKEQLSQLVFSTAVVREVMRLRPAVTILTYHNTEEYTMASGVKAEKGTGFMTLLRYSAISEEAFTKAKEFIPERWIDDEREEALLDGVASNEKHPVRHSEEAILTFGSGPRECPGQYMASKEIVMLLAAICARFDVALAPGQPDPPEEILTIASGPDQVSIILTEV